MSDRDPIWDFMKQRSKDKFDKDRNHFLSEAHLSDDGGWTKHTEYHWSRYIGDKRLDYWPSRKKFQYDGQVIRGDVYKFISKKVIHE